MAPRTRPVERKTDTGSRLRLFARETKRHGDFAMQMPKSTAGLKQLKEGFEPRNLRDGWARDAYVFSDEIGEVGFVMNLQANTGAQCRLQPQKYDLETREWQETDDERVLRVHAAFVGPQGGTAELMRRGFLHLGIAGETLLVGQPVDEVDASYGLHWEFLSSEELVLQRGGKAVRKYDGNTGEPLGDEVYLARIYRSHPMFSGLADSPMRRVLSICQEVLNLTQMVSGIVRSRLAAGILYVPEEITFATDSDPDDLNGDLDEGDLRDLVEEFLKKLAEHLRAPVEDRASAAALVPLLMRGPAEMFDKIGLIEIARGLDTYAQDLRKEALQRLAAGLDIDPAIVEGAASLNHWCKDSCTEVLARGRGWITHEDLHIGDEIYTLNHETGLGAWQPVTDIYRANVDGERMLSMEGCNHSSLSTAAHRWPVVKNHPRVAGSRRRWTTSEAGFGNRDSVDVAARCVLDRPADFKYTDEFVRLVAAYTADGTILHYESGLPYVRICKFQEHEIVAMRRILSDVFGAHGFREHAHPTSTRDGVAFVLRAAESQVLFDVTDELRAVSLGFVDDLTVTQCDVFLDAALEIGDGVNDRGQLMIYQVEPTRLEAFAYAAVVAGRRVTWGVRNQQTGFGDRPLSWLRVSSATSGFRPNSCQQEWVEYTGTIWCPVTPNMTWLARRNGHVFFTGNTLYQVDANFVTKQVRPTGDLLARALTEVYLRAMLEEFEEMDPSESRLYRWIFDPAAIMARTDEAASSRILYDMNVLSSDTLLRANGFAEADKVSPEEQNRNLALQMLQRDPVNMGPVVSDVLGLTNWKWDALPQQGGAEGGFGAPVMPGAPATTNGTPQRKGLPPLGAPIGAPGQAIGGNPNPNKQFPDQQTGMQEPPNPGFSLLTDRLAVAADAAVERALEKAAARFVTKARRVEGLKQRLDNVKGTAVLAAVAPSDLLAADCPPPLLLAEAWDTFGLNARRWIKDYCQRSGLDALAADDTAAFASSKLCEGLQELVTLNMHERLPITGNGTRVHSGLIISALYAAGVR